MQGRDFMVYMNSTGAATSVAEKERIINAIEIASPEAKNSGVATLVADYYAIKIASPTGETI